MNVKIVADKDIPFIDYYFKSAGDLVLVPGRNLASVAIADADILIVRSITKVNQALLENTKVKYVISPTTGVDHCDVDWLAQSGIRWANAHGCNAIAVRDYVVCAIASLLKRGYLSEGVKRAGVIGVGNIGQRVVDVLKLLGFEVLQCDPLRAERENDFPHVPLDQMCELDLLTVHAPLTKAGDFPTYHMLEKDFLQRQRENSILMNTGRGAVIDFQDLKVLGGKLVWALDVWENEPWIDFDILASAEIATPHIAGYTVQSKYRAVEMIYQKAIKDRAIDDIGVSRLDCPRQTLSFDNKKVNWMDVVLAVYDPQQTTALMKQRCIEDPTTAFDELRRNFADRHEFAYVSVENADIEDNDAFILQKLGVQLLS